MDGKMTLSAIDKYSNRVAFTVLARRRIFIGITIALFVFLSLSWTKPDTSWATRILPTRPPSRKGYDRPGYEAPLANGIPLRIIGLGASTVFGAESEGAIGWRVSLRSRLVRAGNKVNMVGSQRIGDMVDNDVEAYPGARIDAVFDFSHGILNDTRPNLAIVYVGSNDNFQNASLEIMFKRYYALVNYVLEASPRATIIMGTLMPTTETELWGGQDRVGGMNAQLRTLYRVFRKEGKPVVLVEMGDDQGVQIENLAWDHMHPSRAGYEIMSRKFFEGILEADARGLLQPPEFVYGMLEDGEEDRLDEGKILQKEEQAKLREVQERLEDEAADRMWEELKTSPWDGSPAVPPDKPVVPIPERPVEERPVQEAPPPVEETPKPVEEQSAAPAEEIIPEAGSALDIETAPQ